MQEINFTNLRDLNEKELLLIEGGGLSELTEKIVYGVGYAVGWLSTRNWSGIPAHESALLGPNARPTG
ncbi:hypothetical protein [Pararhodonellum marinum]|uniref:hypothetical protein n=1 Tax=Pararhodonellum marinum TaxID=2755358 RepID=UPI00188EB970|nr:hypothetical protein [Pararhodonellum marinum]